MAKSSSTAKKAAPKKAAGKAAPKKAAAKKSNKSRAVSNPEPGLTELFTDSIKDLYYAEKKLVTTLPKMQKAATSQALKDAIGEHLDVTKTHVSRLEDVFGLLGEKPKAKKCDAMDGLVEEGQGIVEETEAGSATRDVGIIMASQKIEHYEIASYGTLVQLAATLGEQEISDILAGILAEEKEADETLTQVAENDINYQAAEEDEEEGDDEEEEEDDDEVEEEEEEEEA